MVRQRTDCMASRTAQGKVLLVANTSWYVHNFRLQFIRDLRKRNVEVVVVAPRDEWSEVFFRSRVGYIDLPMSRRGLNPAQDLLLLWRLNKIYRREQPGCVLHHTIKPCIYGSIAARWAGVATTVNMVTGLGYVFTGSAWLPRLLRPLVEAMYRFALKSSDKVFLQNPDDMRYFADRRLVDPSRMAVTFGSGVDLDRYSYVGSPGRDGTCTFLFVGRVLWDKGVGEFVEAARRVRATTAGAVFQILGRLDPGNPTHVAEQVLKGWIQEGCIEYLGETSDVRDVVAAADVVVLPSYREGVPRALLEAMAMGKPLITTDAPGCRETVREGRNGILVPAGDAQALERAVRELLTHPAERERMGEESRRLAVDQFDVKIVNKLLLDSMRCVTGVT
jgi:glycosyltransferase involved in cell wall biosynthesis